MKHPRIVTAAITAALAITTMGAPALAATRYSDVNYSDWYGDSVGYCTRHGLITGIGNGRFGTGTPLTRAQLATILWRNAEPETATAYKSNAANATGLRDVRSNDWYTGAANWAVANGVISGVDHGTYRTFDPNAPVTLEQMLAIIANYVDKDAAAEADTSVLAKFPDETSISSWARQSVAWAAEKGLVSGSGANHALSPRANVARERAATILANACRTKVMDGGAKVNVPSVEDAQAAVAKAKAEYDKAKNLADNAGAYRAKGSVGFFEYLGDTQAETVFQTQQTAHSTKTSADGKTFGSYTHLGQPGDATSLENFRTSLQLVRKGNALRTSDNNFKGLDELYVTNELMALAEMNANWTAGAVTGHPLNFGQNPFSDILGSYGYSNWAENLMVGSANPFDFWYNTEKKRFDSGKANYWDVTHYMNITNPYLNVTGIGRATKNDRNHTYDIEEFGLTKGKAYRLDDYEKLFNQYYDAITNSQKNLQTARDALTRAQWDLDDANAD